MSKSGAEPPIEKIDDSSKKSLCRMTRTEVKNDLAIIINLDWCNGCEFCIAFCPADVLQPSTDVNLKGASFPIVAAPEKCTTCKRCQYLCPDLAIYLVEKNAPPGPALHTQTPQMTIQTPKERYRLNRD